MTPASGSSSQRVYDVLTALTGSMSSYNSFTTEVDCSGTGQSSHGMNGSPVMPDAQELLVDEGKQPEEFCRDLVTLVKRLQGLISEHPYGLRLRLGLVEAYGLLGYPDLVAGEAYKLLVLSDEATDESGEYHEQALAALKADVSNESGLVRYAKLREHPQLADRLEEFETVEGHVSLEVGDEEALVWAKDVYSYAAYLHLIESLAACGCFRSAFNFLKRGFQRFPADQEILKLSSQLSKKFQSCSSGSHIRISAGDDQDFSAEDLPEQGSVRRELYPWNEHEPDRFSSSSLQFLNERMSQVAPKLEVCATDLPILATNAASTVRTVKQLGVCAREDIHPGETILTEKSLLTETSRLHDSFCDACSAKLPSNNAGNQEMGTDIVSCGNCTDTLFCSQECLDLADASYHPAICDTDIEVLEKDAPPAAAADALYSLLLLRALAMAETQSIHPLDLPEVKYIWGDYHNQPLPSAPAPDASSPATNPFDSLLRTLPFTFHHNIWLPLHMLEKMGVNVFESPQYDTWVVNTLYAKFRGTASARQGPDGRPEVGAVHPMWCLANHSCDPNVAWEWDGSMRFRAREERVQWKGKEGARKEPGLRKGEEVLSHYCDVGLPVRERREWAAGALGGMCMCERCVWEDGMEKKKDDQY